MQKFAQNLWNQEGRGKVSAINQLQTSSCRLPVASNQDEESRIGRNRGRRINVNYPALAKLGRGTRTVVEYGARVEKERQRKRRPVRAPFDGTLSEYIISNRGVISKVLVGTVFPVC